VDCRTANEYTPRVFSEGFDEFLGFRTPIADVKNGGSLRVGALAPRALDALQVAMRGDVDVV